MCIRDRPALPAPAPAVPNPVQEDFFADGFGPPPTSVGQPAPSPVVRDRAQVNDPFVINPTISEGNTVGSTPTMNSPTSIGQENRENGSQKRVVVPSPSTSPIFPSSSKSSKSASFSQQPVKSKSRRKSKSPKNADDDERSVSTFKSFRKGLSKRIGKSKSAL